MIVMIELKGAILDFYNILTALQTVSYMCAQVARQQLCATQFQLKQWLCSVEVM